MNKKIINEYIILSELCERRIQELMKEYDLLTNDFARGLNCGMRLVHESNLSYYQDQLKMEMI